MSVSDNLKEIDSILEEDGQPVSEDRKLANTLALVKSRREFLADQVSDLRMRTGRRQIITSAGPFDVPGLAAFGMRTFGSIQDLRIALRAEVMLKMIRQAHEAELQEPGERATSGIIGTPEW